MDTGLLEFLIASWAIFLRFQVAQVTFWLPWATANLDPCFNRIFYIACRDVYIRHFVYIHMIDMDMLHNIVSNPFIRFANK
jgi:hypothetical protein